MTFPDAFVHLPQLRGRVTPPEASALRVTPAVLAEWDRRALEQGRPADWRWSETALCASREAVLGAPGRELWVYAYGSLMWDPGVHFTEVRRADLAGFRRRFTFRTSVGRGSPERPGLMLSLEPGAGHCNGLAFRVAPEHAEAESLLLWRREMLRGSYCPQLLPVRTPQGDVDALVMTANPAHPDHVGEMPLDDTARIIARAAGMLGSNRAYLEQLAAQLAALDIDDEYIAALQARLQQLAPGA